MVVRDGAIASCAIAGDHRSVKEALRGLVRRRTLPKSRDEFARPTDAALSCSGRRLFINQARQKCAYCFSGQTFTFVLIFPADLESDSASIQTETATLSLSRLHAPFTLAQNKLHFFPLSIRESNVESEQKMGTIVDI